MATNAIIESNPFEVSFEDKSHGEIIKNTIKDMVQFTKSIVVDSDSSYKKITSLYRQAREWKKCIDAKRKEMTEPLRKQTAVINDKAKEFTDPLDSVIEMANSKAVKYLRLLEEIKNKEDEELRQAASLFDATDELYIPPMEKTVRGEGAIAVTKTEKDFKVLDLSKVPMKYLMVNEEAIKRDVKLGLSEIPGLEIFETTKTQLRIR